MTGLHQFRLGNKPNFKKLKKKLRTLKP